MRVQLTRDQSWMLVYIGMMLIGFSLMGFAWVIWPDAFISLIKTLLIPLTELSRMV